MARPTVVVLSGLAAVATTASQIPESAYQATNPKDTVTFCWTHDPVVKPDMDIPGRLYSSRAE